MVHHSGHLDPSWGYSDISERVTDLSNLEKSEEEDTTLERLVQDSSVLHSLCLKAFRTHADDANYLSNEGIFVDSLNFIMRTINMDPPFDADDADELWSGKMNFSEFYLLCSELFSSMHRSMSTDLDVDDIMANSFRNLRL
jgi:hypothetical protein